MSPLGIYVHIPFCVRRCKYCDFVSYPWSEEGKIFVELLFTELNLRIRDACFAGRKVQSVYFGGGTPSLLEPSFFEHFLGLLKRQMSFSLLLRSPLKLPLKLLLLRDSRSGRLLV